MWFKKIAPFFFLLFIGKTATASHPVINDSSNGILLSESKIIRQGIDYEKKRIAFHYKTADSTFFNLIDNVSAFISEQEISLERKNNYFKRLHVFLQNIHQSYSDNYFKSGSYSASLNYFPLLIEWDVNDELFRNIKRFSSFSIKAIRLIPNDTVAEDFLFDYLSDYPDDIFRYVEEFDDRKFALPLLEKATKLAPESAKRYYATTNTINTILSRSNDSLVKKSYEIFNRYGSKSNAYLLLDAITNNEMSIASADSVSRNPYGMFHLLIEQAAVQGITYSSYRFTYNYCIDVIRKINNDNPSPVYRQNIFNRYTPEELFVLLCYGYKESTGEVFSQLLKTVKEKTPGTSVNNTVAAGLDKEKLKELVIYCDKSKILPQLLDVVDDERKNYLLALAAEKRKEIPTPVFKSFEKEKTIANNEPAGKWENDTPPVTSEKKNGAEQLAQKTQKETAINSAIPATEQNLTASVESNLVIAAHKADIAPIPIQEPIEPITIVLDDKTRSALCMKKNILQTIQNIPSFIKQDNAEQLLTYAAQKEPDELFKKIDDFKNNRFSKSILEQCAINAPVSLKRYLYNSSQPVNYILQYSTNEVVKKILEINPQIGYRSKPLLLLDDIIKGKLSVSDAVEISSDQDKLFSALVKIISTTEYTGKYSIDHEMRDYSLRFIREINDKIATGESHPFASSENFKSTELYFLMLYGRDEVFTSTFNGLFNRFIEKLSIGGGSNFLQSVSHNQFRDFISLCSNFGKLEELLSRFSQEEKQKLLIAYISNLEKEQDDLSTVVLIAEAISNLKDNQLLTLLQSNIKKEFDRVKSANDQIGLSIYGVLSSMISGNAKVEVPWYKTVAQQFKISPVGLLKSSSLFNEKNLCIQQMYFYNDDDGRSSFINFMSTYKNQPAWSIEDKRSYVRIYSNQGMQVEVFANKPELEETGIDAINEYLKENKLSPSVVIHRGHSYHTESTLEKISSSAKLVFVGSCGGFYKVSIALENAPDAHIISTKQVGTKTINDAMLFALNENIRDGKDIVWNDFWDKMRLKLGNNQYFSDYIPPNKNLEAVFIRAYYKLLGV